MKVPVLQAKTGKKTFIDPLNLSCPLISLLKLGEMQKTGKFSGESFVQSA
jgi:hypothetical protein